MTAVFTDGTAVIDLLLRKTDVSIDSTGRTGNTLLMFAAMWGKYDIVDYLLKKGADINARNSGGDTALSLARKNGYRNVAALLALNGAVTQINTV